MVGRIGFLRRFVVAEAPDKPFCMLGASLCCDSPNLLNNIGKYAQPKENKDGGADFAKRCKGDKLTIADSGQGDDGEEIGIDPAPAFGIVEKHCAGTDDGRDKAD